MADIRTSPTEQNKASCRPVASDWFAEYLAAQVTISTLRNSLAWIEGYSRTCTTYPQTTANLVAHVKQLHARADGALKVFKGGTCDGCGEHIAPEFLEAATQTPPDYMPEDFRKRATVVLCELCRTEGE